MPIRQQSSNDERSPEKRHGRYAVTQRQSEIVCTLPGINGDDRIIIARMARWSETETPFRNPMSAALQRCPSRFSSRTRLFTASSWTVTGRRILKDRDTRKSGTGLSQQLQTLRGEVREVHENARRVPAGTRQTCRDTAFQRFQFQINGNDWKGRRFCASSPQRRTADRYKHIHFAGDDFVNHRHGSARIAVGHSNDQFDLDGRSKAGLAQAATDRFNTGCDNGLRSSVDEANARGGLLRSRRKRPRRRTTDHRKKFPTPHVRPLDQIRSCSTQAGAAAAFGAAAGGRSPAARCRRRCR